MLKFVEFGLLAVSLLIIFGLVATSPRNISPGTSDPLEAGDVEVGPLQKIS